jgi:phosphoribosyl 1,2-cyclic phosphodiesterase/ActR/RegA family two-component response regulator
LLLDSDTQVGKVKTLVLIDGDALTRALVSQCLLGHEWRVLEAEDGQAGLDLVLSHKPSAVLCDIRTPKRNGFQVCRLIREQVGLKSTGIILMTVSRFANDRQTAFAAGADDYLLKPIAPAELVRTVTKHGSNGEAAPAPPPSLEITGPTLIRFWGVRGSIPTPGPETSTYGGNTSCVEVRVGNQIVILDAGSGIRRLGQALIKEVSEKGFELSILITHTHWDHIQGFPFFVPAYNPRINIRILGYEGAVHGLRAALFEQMQSAFFPVGLDQIAPHLTFDELDDMEFQLGLVRVRAMFANHPGICLAYRLSTPAGDIVYMPDHEAYERCEIERQKAERDTSTQGLEYARIEDQKVVDFLRNADVVIADSQYDAIEYPSRRGWGHTCADDTVQLAARAGAKQLFLFHHDPDHDDEKIAEMVARGQKEIARSGSNLRVGAASEGAEIKLTRAAK